MSGILAIVRTGLDKFRYALSRTRVFIVAPASSGGLIDPRILHGLQTLLSPLTPQIVGVKTVPSTGFAARDCLVVVAVDQLDGQAATDAFSQQLELAEAALAAKAQVLITGTLRTLPPPAVIARLKRLKGAIFLLHSRSSLSRLAGLISNDIFFFPSFLLFDAPDPPLAKENFLKPFAAQVASSSHRLVVNLSEGCFRSLFDHHTDQNRRLFVALVLDQILCFSPQPFIFFASSPTSASPGSVFDATFHDMAMAWLNNNGHSQSFAIVPPLVAAADLLSLFRSVDISIVTSNSLLPIAIESESPFLALVGQRGSPDWRAKIRSLMEDYSQKADCVVSELYAISYELPRVFAGAAPRSLQRADALIEGIAPARWRSALLAICMHDSSRSLQRLSPEHVAIPSYVAKAERRPEALTQRMHQPLVGGTYVLSDPAIHAKLLGYATKYFQEKQIQAGLRHGDFAHISFDGDPSFIPELLEREQPHEEDYAVFRWFRGGHSLILDIGANWGYSAASIWSCAPETHIISFEAIPMYRPCLQALRELRPDHYSYLLSGLSNKDEQLSFSIPVVDHVALTALTTASPTPCLPSLIDGVLNHVSKWMTGTSTFSFQFIDFTVPVRRLDDLLAAHPSSLKSTPVVAIKIDVEGMEYEVISGGEKTLSTYQPLIMVEENQNRNQSLMSFLNGLGYLRAERIGPCLRLSDGSSAAHYNGFFVHRLRCSEYQDLGLLM